MAGGDTLRPAPHKNCITCRYCCDNQYGDKICIFLFEMILMGRVPVEDCRIMKDIDNGA